MSTHQVTNRPGSNSSSKPVGAVDQQLRQSEQEQLLRQERRRLLVADTIAAQSFQQAVVNASPDVISVWDLDSESVVWANRSIPGMLGYSDLDFASMGGHVRELVVAADRPTAAAALLAASNAESDDVIHVDYRMRHQDGTIGWFSQRTAPLIRDARGRVTQLVGILRDTTDEMANRAAVRDSEALFTQLTESLDVILLVRGWDPSEFLYISPGYQKIFGYDPMVSKETPEQSLNRIHSDDRDRFRRDYWAASAAGSWARIEYRVVLSAGEERWLRATTMPVADRPGARRRSASIVEDITVSRQAEAALTAARDAEKASAAKNEFLSRMSHELRTPLNAVLGFAQLLELDQLTDDQQQAVQQILRGGQHLTQLIDDVLDISKIEGDRLDLSMESVPIVVFLTETVDMMRALARAAGVGLTYSHDDAAARPVARADHRRLRQVVLNLLSNAIKFNHPGGRVEVSCAVADDSRLSILVQDTGRGIREEDLPRLFTPFDRLGAQETEIEGTGVGLALSHRLMAAMGGTLTATSLAGIGSAFIAAIPAATDAPAGDPEPADLMATGPAMQRPASPLPSPTNTLLYIEDNSSNIALMQQLVSRRPAWSLMLAGRGALGLEMAGSTLPDLILLDMHLPDMHGLDILQRLRSHPMTKDLAIVMFSADANPHQIQRLLTAGANDYLVKPLSVALLLALLDSTAEMLDLAGR
ncbi:MAG: PAS domain-containing protein [Nakamurella sp.]